MSRVIQDSDDELDDELEVDTHQSEKDASPKHSTSDASSTEALRRQIEAAHRAHLQSQFSVLGGNTSELHAQKRKLPDDFNSNSASTEDFKTAVATKTSDDDLAELEVPKEQVADDELLSHTSQLSQAGDERPGDDVDELKTNVNSKSYDAIATVGAPKTPGASVIVHSDMGKKSPSMVQVVIPAKSPNPVMDSKSKKAKLKSVASTEVTPEDIKVERKRGRGRPKKAAKASHVEEISHESDLQQSMQGHTVGATALSMEKTTQLDSVQSQEDKDLGNASTAKSREELQCSESEDTMTAEASTKATPEPATLPDRPEMEPITPERVKKPTPREQPSSNRAKVPYRVGLSKRARIAPLLRTVKK
ncbi:hypothetical protein E8E13_004063 [Curvularia kusanoi]|uniref:Uncharacterized protein n=1 Tax=Curvularia kusanoi TaxID=90978 RepID=A0A9P4W8I1_CURKU|nr:hypothetical protein E8E13_004063 [Curvularia kusanoi]